MKMCHVFSPTMLCTKWLSMFFIPPLFVLACEFKINFAVFFADGRCKCFLFCSSTHIYITPFGPLWKTGSHRATMNWKQTTVQNFKGNMIYILSVTYTLHFGNHGIHIYIFIYLNTKYPTKVIYTKQIYFIYTASILDTP